MTLAFSYVVLLQPEKSCTPYGGDSSYKVVTYERTPIMSTYLVAFVVGEYDYVEGVDTDGVKVRVYTGVGKAEQGRFALDVSTCTRPDVNVGSCHVPRDKELHMGPEIRQCEQ